MSDSSNISLLHFPFWFKTSCWSCDYTRSSTDFLLEADHLSKASSNNCFSTISSQVTLTNLVSTFASMSWTPGAQFQIHRKKLVLKNINRYIINQTIYFRKNFLNSILATITSHSDSKCNCFTHVKVVRACTCYR